jgi:hypothetical protein
MNHPRFQFAECLQTGPVCCKLQTACKLRSSKIIALRQFAVCKRFVCRNRCKLEVFLAKSEASVCRFSLHELPSTYGREGDTRRLTSGCLPSQWANFSRRVRSRWCGEGVAR